MAAGLPRHFGLARDEIRILLTETPTLRPPLAKWLTIRKIRSLSKFLAWGAAAGAETKL